MIEWWIPLLYLFFAGVILVVVVKCLLILANEFKEYLKVEYKPLQEKDNEFGFTKLI